jgi:RimJ/RimL family protein N-acetyltransferase
MLPADIARVEGPNLTLRLILPEDADYVHRLRIDPSYSLYLSEVRGTAEDQRRWIEGYKAREADLREIYYVIQRKDCTRCGLVRLYDINSENFTWGSWILDHNKTRGAALESAMLSFGVGFDGLGLSHALVDVRIDNDRALAVYRRLRMTELRRDDQNVYFTYPESDFSRDRARYLEIIQGKLGE